MKLKDCEFEKLLPLFMQRERDDAAMARAVNATIRDMAEKAALCSDWAHIDELPEEYLDALAWELDVDWYAPKSDRTLEIKRELLKNADQVHMKLGTKAAVESVVKDIFGDGHVEEWFENGDSPGYFRVWISAVLNEDNVARFMKTVGQVKNVRSHLKAVTCRFTGDMDGPWIDPGSVISEYGETDIYGQIWYTTTLDQTELEAVDAWMSKVKTDVVFAEDIDVGAAWIYAVENSEGVSASIVEQSDPCYFHNGIARHDGTIYHNSFYREEDL